MSRCGASLRPGLAEGAHGRVRELYLGHGLAAVGCLLLAVFRADRDEEALDEYPAVVGMLGIGEAHGMDQLVDEDVAFYGTANGGAVLCGIDGGVRWQKDVGQIHHGRALESELVLGVEAVTGCGAEQNLGVGLGGGGFEF